MTDHRWHHKSLCLYHCTRLIGASHFTEQEICESQWKICHCNEFYNQHVQPNCPQFQYRMGFQEIFTNGIVSDLHIMIDDQKYEIPLFIMNTTDISELMQSNKRPYQIGTGVFFDSKIVYYLNDDIWFIFRLKNRYRQKEIEIPNIANCLKEDIDEYIFQCWTVYGIHQDSNRFTRYIAIHDNPFCREPDNVLSRIVLYIHSSKHYQIKINGKKPKSFQQCQEIKKEIIQQNQQKQKQKPKPKQKHKRKFEQIQINDSECCVQSNKKRKLTHEIF